MPADAYEFTATTMRIESGRAFADPVSGTLLSSLESLGFPGLQWMVVQQLPERGFWFFQVFRESQDFYSVEIGEGEDVHLVTLAEGAQAVLDLCVAWHRGDGA